MFWSLCFFDVCYDDGGGRRVLRYDKRCAPLFFLQGFSSIWELEKNQNCLYYTWPRFHKARTTSFYFFFRLFPTIWGLKEKNVIRKTFLTEE